SPALILSSGFGIFGGLCGARSHARLDLSTDLSTTAAAAPAEGRAAARLGQHGNGRSSAWRALADRVLGSHATGRGVSAGKARPPISFPCWNRLFGRWSTVLPGGACPVGDWRARSWANLVAVCPRAGGRRVRLEIRAS